MTKKQKKELIRIGISAAAFLLACLLPVTGYVRLAVFLAVYLVAGSDILLEAVRNICHGQIFDENFLMALATVGAFFVGEYPEAIAVMLFYRVGEFFQSYAVGKSRKSISSLMELCPEYANRLKDGELEQVDPELIEIGDLIVIKPGERIPLDGVVTEGSSSLDTSALTGESMPRQAKEGDAVMSGCVNQSGTLTVRVTKEYSDSTVARILELVESAGERKAEAENFITKFAAYYTPVVVIAALLLAVIPPLVLEGASFSDWIYRALNFLVVSCPCALVISIPLGFFGGIGGAAKKGILVKGSNYLEALASAEIAVFDKTGTLTKGNFAVTKCAAAALSEEEVLYYAAGAELYSNHPVAESIKKAYAAKEAERRKLSPENVSGTEELAGRGLRAVVDGKTVLAGNGKLLAEEGISYTPMEEAGTVVYVVVDGVFAGSLLVEDEIKPDAKEAIASLKASGVKKTVMLTGDAKEVGEKVAKELGLDQVCAELLPADKVARMEALLAEKSEKGKLVFAGDGINDAPVLAGADIGIAMGGLGSDAAIEAADIVIMTDEPSKIAEAIRIARRTLRIVKQNVVFALGVKILVLILSACGSSNLWAAVFADVGVSVIAILNAMRALKN